MVGVSLGFPRRKRGSDALGEMLPLAEGIVEAGAEVIMVKQRVHQITYEMVESCANLKEKIGIDILFHPAERGGNGKWYLANDGEGREVLTEKYRLIFEGIRDFGFLPAFIFHGGRMKAEGEKINGKDKMSEKRVEEETLVFVEMLREVNLEVAGGKIDLVIENMPAPGRNKGEHPFPYSIRQVKRLVFNSGNGGAGKPALNFCLDVAHAQLSVDELSSYADDEVLPIKWMHISGNDLSDDAHRMPKTSNVKSVKEVERLMARKGMGKILEINSRVLRESIGNNKLKCAVDSLKKNKIPENGSNTRMLLGV